MLPRHETWMRGLILNQACTEYRCLHISGKGEQGEEVCLCRANIDREKDLEQQLQVVVKDIDEAVDMHAKEYQRMQRYQLVALHNDRVLGHIIFRVDPPSDSLSTIDSEPADTKGLMSLGIRGNEAMMRMLLSELRGMTEYQSKVCESAQKRIHELEEQRMRDFELREQMLSQQAERDMEAYALRMSEERKDRLFDRAGDAIKPLLPDIGRKLGLLPEGKSNGRDKSDQGSKAVIQLFLKSLSEDQQDQLFKVLRPDQLAMVAALMGGEEEEKEKEPDKSDDKSVPVEAPEKRESQ